MLIGDTFGAISNSTTFSASKRNVQRARPSGGAEHANAVNRALKAPSKIIFRDLDRGFLLMAASTPSFTNRSLIC